MNANKINTVKLFWVEAFDHAEDWFVVAETKEDAEQFFSDYEGYDQLEDEIFAMEVCVVPESVVPTELPCHPDETLIMACDGKITSIHNQELFNYFKKEDLEALGAETRIVKIKDQVFIEGNVAQVTIEQIKREKGNFN